MQLELVHEKTELGGGCVVLLNCKWLLCCINTEGKPWEAYWSLGGYATRKFDFAVCLWLLFPKAGNDLKRALNYFGNDYYIGIFC